MSRFETESLALIPGLRVRAKVVSHQPWGVIAQIVGHEQVGASIDMLEQFGGTARGDELQALYPPVGAEIDASAMRFLWPTDESQRRRRRPGARRP